MGCPVTDLTCELIRRPSVTPEDAGCQALLGDRLARRGFRVEHLRHGEVDNLVAWHGSDGPGLFFLGHTDVVPPGPLDAWQSPPFEPTVRDGRLFGRGAADMKGAVAAFVVALERFVDSAPSHGGRVGVILTSDEEGPAEDGVRKVAPALTGLGAGIDHCIVGEPSSQQQLGDVMRIGRRGSLNIELTILGVQGHVAFPELADNPIHRALEPLAELVRVRWDEGDEHFPPTSFQIAHVAAGPGVYNVIPGTFTIRCNFRYAPCHEPDALLDAVRSALDRHGVRYELRLQDSGRPFITRDTELADAVAGAVRQIAGVEPERNTGGGTSDGRFIAPLGAQVVELGVVNASIHQVDEWVDLEALGQLARIYEAAARSILPTS